MYSWAAVKGSSMLIKGGAVLLVAGLVFGSGHWAGSRKGAEQVAELRLAQSKQAEKAAQAMAALEADYRNKERDLGNTFIQVNAKHQEAMRRAQAERNTLAAALRDGSERLHDRWTGCMSAAAEVAGRSGGSDAGARDREESALRAVVAAAEADAQIRALQALLKAERSNQPGG